MSSITTWQEYLDSIQVVNSMLQDDKEIDRVFGKIAKEQPMGDPDSDMKKREKLDRIATIRANETAHVRELKRLYAEHQRFIIKETMMKHAGYMVEKHGDEISVYRRVEVDE